MYRKVYRRLRLLVRSRDPAQSADPKDDRDFTVD